MERQRQSDRRIDGGNERMERRQGIKERKEEEKRGREEEGCRKRR